VFELHEGDKTSAFGAELSRKFGCPALVVLEYDDDVLCYQLYESGALTDEYDSAPDYFDFQMEHNPPRGPQGGDAARLCAALDRKTARQGVDRILHKVDLRLQAPDRHRALAQALGMPMFAVGYDYGALQSGELPEGLDEFDVIFTDTEAA
jgi:hypothetical protein